MEIFANHIIKGEERLILEWPQPKCNQMLRVLCRNVSIELHEKLQCLNRNNANVIINSKHPNLLLYIGK